MDRECRAGHYILRHKGVIWCQGENNRETKAVAYMKALLRVRDGLFSSMEYESENRKTGLVQQPDFFGILMVRAAAADPLSLEDFQLNGPRTAQYMASALSTGKFRDIYLASQVEELWSSDASVSRYFYEKYGSEEEFQEAYPTYSQWMPMPDEVRDLHGSIHFSQIADNEIGMDAAENICCVLGLIDPGAVENPGIEFLTESGVQPGNSIIIPAEIEKPLFAVRVFPAYMTGKLELSYTDNIRIKNGIPKRIGPGEIIIRAWLPENRE